MNTYLVYRHYVERIGYYKVTLDKKLMSSVFSNLTDLCHAEPTNTISPSLKTFLEYHPYLLIGEFTDYELENIKTLYPELLL